MVKLILMKYFIISVRSFIYNQIPLLVFDCSIIMCFIGGCLSKTIESFCFVGMGFIISIVSQSSNMIFRFLFRMKLIFRYKHTLCFIFYQVSHLYIKKYIYIHSSLSNVSWVIAFFKSLYCFSNADLVYLI